MYSTVIVKKILEGIKEVREDTLLVESGIKMPEGTRSAKIVFH